MAFTPGVYYLNKNSSTQIYNILSQGVYDHSINIVPYYNPSSGTKLVYVNQISSLTPGVLLSVKINGTPQESVVVLDNGYYLVEFNPPYGIFTIAVTTPDGHQRTATFKSTNIHLLLSLIGDSYSSLQQEFLESAGGAVAIQYNDNKPFCCMANASQMGNGFGANVGFAQPSDWTYQAYAYSVGGCKQDGILSSDSSTLAPTVMSSLTGYSFDNLLSGEYLYYNGQKFSSISSVYKLTLSNLIAESSTLPFITVCQDPLTNILYAVFNNKSTDVANGNYEVGINADGIMQMVLLSSSIFVSYLLPICVIAYVNGIVSIKQDYRIFMSNVKGTVSGIYPSLKDGAATLSIKNVINAVTGYSPSDSDFNLLKTNVPFQTQKQYDAITLSSGESIYDRDLYDGNAGIWDSGVQIGAGMEVVPTGSSDRFISKNAGITGTTEPVWPSQLGVRVIDISESPITWELVELGTPPAWKANTVYNIGDRVSPTSSYMSSIILDHTHEREEWICSDTTSGPISGSSEPNWFSVTSKNGLISDNNIVWKLIRFGMRPYSSSASSYDGIANTNDPYGLEYQPGINANSMNWGKAWANKSLIKIVTDGITYGSEIVIRGNQVTDYVYINDKAIPVWKDSLAYSWLNPYSTSGSYGTAGTSDIGFYYDEFTYASSSTFTTRYGFTNGSELVFRNGIVLIKDTDYTVTSVNSITITATLTAGDKIGIFYIQTIVIDGIKTQTVDIANNYPSGLLVELEYSASSFNNIQVWYNGNNSRYLDSAQDWQYVDSTHIRILSSLYSGDSLYIRYATYDTSGWFNYEAEKSDIVSNIIILPYKVTSGSIKFYVNGLQQSDSLFSVASDLVTLTIDSSYFNSLSSTDILLFQYSIYSEFGKMSVVRTTTGKPATIYTQDINFYVDYTTGEILWIPTADTPSIGDSYKVTYTYFPKDILDHMIKLLKPATGIVEQRYFTSSGKEFNPYSTTNWPNKLPCEDLIF